ncbi:DNA cytosine methyltransferase [Roseomonas gilardii]|uniref:DNA cytosine methyltransferase n=1 Tax=Roseomonas gilardii TaxID=257708 RepID=UPI0011A672D7|nr:DNA cytosine methyltransferase [Roseomonas gilardii]
MSDASSADHRSPHPLPQVAQTLASVVDVFCGAGGLAHGLFLEGFAIAAGVDLDEACRFPFETNNLAPFIRKDVATLTSTDLRDLFYPGLPRVLVGCAPCQPFSTYKQKGCDPKWQLVGRFAELVEQTLPDVVSMENVPRLLDFHDGSVFNDFRHRLVMSGYCVWHGVVFMPGYGLPQRRSRLVVLASRLGSIVLEPPFLTEGEYPTVDQTIGGLRPLQAGETDPTDVMHAASGISDVNFQRLRASRPGGTWHDWDVELVADCHRSATGRGYRSVYGRMRGDEPAPTITTQFYGFGSGRFGHPTQDRALSLREGAMLQSFPRTYKFSQGGVLPSAKVVGRMIGNAVPVALGRAIGRSIRGHLLEHQP